MIQFIKEFFGFKKIEVAEEKVDPNLNLAQQMYALSMKVLSTTTLPDAMKWIHNEIKQEAERGSFEWHHTFEYYFKSHNQFRMTEDLKKRTMAQLVLEGFKITHQRGSIYYYVSWNDAR